jgi:flagellar basal body rod protein FlgF
MTEVIAVGRITTLTKNVVYALPARAGRLQADSAVQISPDGATWDTLTNAETVGVDISSGFIKTVSTTADAVVMFKTY